MSEGDGYMAARELCIQRAKEIRRQADALDRLAEDIDEMRGEVETMERTHNLTPTVDEHLDMAHSGVVADAREMRQEAEELEKAAEII